MKFFVLRVLPVLLVLAGVIEGVTAGLSLLNQPNDFAVLAGVVLILLTLCAAGSFFVWFIKRRLKGVVR